MSASAPAPVETPAAPPAAARRPVWALPAVVIAILAIAAALVVGLRGLGGNPIVSTAPDGTATISGTWEPFECAGGCVQGYVQDGARSVFVRLPSSCSAPAREAHVTVRGRLTPSLGKQAYTAVGCPAG
jgi:hypothetical protein